MVMILAIIVIDENYDADAKICYCLLVSLHCTHYMDFFKQGGINLTNQIFLSGK